MVGSARCADRALQRGVPTNIVTTLDLEKQQAIERRVADYVANNRNRGIEKDNSATRQSRCRRA
jgi:membrane carboxypeptidase/penicillin-binding protein PbpC